MTFERAAVIGTGMMGPGIAATFALGGVHATVVSRREISSLEGLDKARKQVLYLEQAGLVETAAANAALELLSASHDLDDAVAYADLVVESAPENMVFKQELFGHLDRVARPHTVLASNTSGLSITEIATRCTRPERVITTHFWNPPYLMPLVEIVKGERTAHDVALSLRDLLVRCGKTPVIVKKDRPGQLGNRLQIALIREAVNIVAEGIADAEDVDLAAKAGFGLRLPVYGILEHQDMIGLDMGTGIVDYITADLNNDPKAPDLMHDLIKQGKLGAKSGQGFYDWSKKDPAEVRSLRDRWLRDFLKTPYAKTLRPNNGV
jgi:3-hydroxybutyryl-CoA dehydrogenase